MSAISRCTCDRPCSFNPCPIHGEQGMHPQPPPDGAGPTTIKQQQPADLIKVHPPGHAEVLRIQNDGRLFWLGREVETDGEFRAAMLDLRDALLGLPVHSRPAPPAAEPGSLNAAEVVEALKNIGYAVECGACMEVFYTGATMAEHTHPAAPAPAAEQDTQVERDAVYAWLGFWRDKMPPEAVTSLQNILGPHYAAPQPSGVERARAVIQRMVEHLDDPSPDVHAAWTLGLEYLGLADTAAHAAQKERTDDQ